MLKSDTFFFISSLGFIIVTVLVVIGIIYVLQILKTIKQISKTAKEGTETIVEGIHEAKASVSKDGFVPKTVISIFKDLYKKRNIK